jgi:glycosyltransferase involved in cell wall biosynthesis
MKHSPTISVIIPAQNEQDSISDLIYYLKESSRTKDVVQIIVAVNGSDLTAVKAKNAGAVVIHVGNLRSVAMNGGQKHATGDILYFLHADSRPPIGWDSQIINAYSSGYHSGTFRLQFDSGHPLLRLSAWFTRFSWKFIRFGDQSLFVGHDEFIKARKFDEDMLILEDREIINRITQYSKFVVIPGFVTTSSRKYNRYGYWRLQSVYVIINLLYYLRLSQPKIIVIYQHLIR